MEDSKQVTCLSTLSAYEYELQLAHFTPDLHVIRGWTLGEESEGEIFKQRVKDLGSSVLHSWVKLNDLKPEYNLSSLLQSSSSLRTNTLTKSFVVGEIPPPIELLGDATESLIYILFHIAPGRSLLHTPESTESFIDRTIPDECTSVVLCSESSWSRHYRVKRSDQILPFAAIEVEFKRINVEIVDPICEACQAHPAVSFCQADRVHLCELCDEKTHSGNPVFQRHKRVPAKQSPHQFGSCHHHPTACIDSVCMTCFELLCPLCLVVGEHAKSNVSEHPIISTLDAYKLACQSVSVTEDTLDHQQKELHSKLDRIHNQLAQIFANYNSLKKRIDLGTRDLIKHILTLGERKLNYINSIKRASSLKLLLSAWMDSTLTHMQYAMNPSNFLLYSHKHDLTKTFLLAQQNGLNEAVTSESQIVQDLPGWLKDKINIEGKIQVTTKSAHVLAFSLPEDEEKKNKENEKPILPLQDSSSSPFSSSSSAVAWVPFKSDTYGMDLNEVVESQSFVSLEKPMEKPMETGVVAHAKSVNETYTSIDQDKEEQEDHSSLYKRNVASQTVNETSIKLWRFLSDMEFGCLYTLLKHSQDTERVPFLNAVCHLANDFGSLKDLTKYLILNELKNIVETPQSLIVVASPLINNFLTVLVSRNFLLEKKTYSWITQTVEPAVQYVKQSLKSTCEESDLELLADSAVESFICRLTSTPSVPSNIRAILYMMNDALCYSFYKKLETERQITCPVAIALCSQILLTTVLAHSFSSSSRNQEDISIRKKCLVCLKFIGQHIWENVIKTTVRKKDNNSASDNLHSKLATSVFQWMSKFLYTTRLTSPLQFSRKNSMKRRAQTLKETLLHITSFHRNFAASEKHAEIFEKLVQFAKIHYHEN